MNNSGLNKSVETQIQEKHDALSKSERIVASAVLLHKRDLAQFSQDNLAHLTGVSKATVARFLKNAVSHLSRRTLWKRAS